MVRQLEPHVLSLLTIWKLEVQDEKDDILHCLSSWLALSTFYQGLS